jgi:hypothetical protein
MRRVTIFVGDRLMEQSHTLARASPGPAHAGKSGRLARWLNARTVLPGGSAMNDRNKRREAPTTVTRAEFIRDPAGVLRRAETTRRPIVIADAHGRPSAIVSAPRDEREPRR